MTDTMVIRSADWLVAYDPARESHVYLRNANLAFTGNTITYVGPRYQGEAAREIDGRERLVTPGLVNIHSHPSSEPLRKGITDETLSPGFHRSSLYEFLTVFDNDAEGRVACLQVALAELLLSGCTTVTDLSSLEGGLLSRVTVHAIDAAGEYSVAAMNAAAPLHHWLWRSGDKAPLQHPVRAIQA